METTISCRMIEFGSKEQKESIELRRKILRFPIGLDFNAEDLESENTQFHFAAFLDAKLVAVLIMVKYGQSVVKMRQVAVDDHLQGKGIGKALVLYSENWAIANQLSQIQLHARSNAVPFYKSMQYEIIGDQFLEVGIPHFKMQKMLI
jgi:predicted GNAT family N-acyltransferase